MAAETPIDELPYRDWQMERVCDKQFARVVPPVKWDFFAARLRPLADDCAEEVRERLFAGVMHPFHYHRAKGWMGKIFREVLRAADYRDLTADEMLKQAFGDAAVEPAFVIYHWVGHPVYAAQSLVMLDWLKRGWLNIDDTFVLCAENTPTVALFWEGTGPYFGKRGHRRLIGGAA
jgi:hypothetical protein